MPKYPRETVEFLGVTVVSDGEVVTSGVELSVVPLGSRPGEFTPATILEGKTGTMIEGMTPGIYTVWWRYADNPEIPVRAVEETIEIT